MQGELNAPLVISDKFFVSTSDLCPAALNCSKISNSWGVSAKNAFVPLVFALTQNIQRGSIIHSTTILIAAFGAKTVLVTLKPSGPLRLIKKYTAVTISAGAASGVPCNIPAIPSYQLPQ
jgi:hypothetical protein